MHGNSGSVRGVILVERQAFTDRVVELGFFVSLD